MDTSKRLATRGGYGTRSRLSRSSHDARFPPQHCPWTPDPCVLDACSVHSGGMLGGPATTPFGIAHAPLSPLEPLRDTCTSQRGWASRRGRGSALQCPCALRVPASCGLTPPLGMGTISARDLALNTSQEGIDGGSAAVLSQRAFAGGMQL